MELTAINTTLGKTFADHLARPVLQIGELAVSAHSLVNEVGCANLNAAQGLSATLKRIRCRSIKELANLDPMSLYRVQGCGHTQVYVAMCLLEHHGIDPAKWWGWDVRGSSVQRRARNKKKKGGAHDVPAET